MEVPGAEEKEHRGAGGEGPAVRVKEVHPGIHKTPTSPLWALKWSTCMGLKYNYLVSEMFLDDHEQKFSISDHVNVDVKKETDFATLIWLPPVHSS